MIIAANEAAKIAMFFGLRSLSSWPVSMVFDGTSAIFKQLVLFDYGDKSRVAGRQQRPSL